MSVEKKPRNDSVQARMSGFQRLGLAVAAAFYLVAVAWVFALRPGGATFDPDVKILTMAHWQLEDGFREGIAEAIKQYEAVKLQQGQKVKVIQITIPWRGYVQWMTTQFVGGKPVDVLEVTGNAAIHYKYMRSLATYLGQPNPYNAKKYLDEKKGYPEDVLKLQDIAWKDTYFDGMEGSFNEAYADYFAIGLGFNTMRLHMDQKLVQDAGAGDKMPSDVPEWLDVCQRVKAYGEATQQPLGAIGVRGTDKETLATLYTQYYSETNANLLDKISRYCDGKVLPVDTLKGLREGTVDPASQTAAVEVLADMGQYFITGFRAMDLEQARYLFFTGRVAFFATGTWESWSLIQNSPHKVKVGVIPQIGTKSRHSKYFTGPVSESGIKTGMRFGIPKASKNAELALDFMQFLSSYETNQMVMEKCKWGPAVRFARYKESDADFKPHLEGNPGFDAFPFCNALTVRSGREMLQRIERIIVDKPEDPSAVFMQGFRSPESKTVLLDEAETYLSTLRRELGEREKQRSQLSVGLLRNNASEEKIRLELRRKLAAESLPDALGLIFTSDLLRQEYKKL